MSTKLTVNMWELLFAMSRDRYAVQRFNDLNTFRALQRRGLVEQGQGDLTPAGRALVDRVVNEVTV